MQDKLSNCVPLSAAELAAGITGLGLLQVPFKRLGLGNELAKHLINAVKVHAQYAYKMRARLIKPIIEEVKGLRLVHAEACIELVKLGLPEEGSIADYYKQLLEERTAHGKLIWRYSLFSIRQLRAECEKMLSNTLSSDDTAKAFYLGQLCSDIENARYYYFHQEHEPKMKAKYGNVNQAKGQWRAELGWRLYFDYWIKGLEINRAEIQQRYLSILPKNYMSKMKPETLTKWVLQQQRFYACYDKRVPRLKGAGRKPTRHS
jgi:hypothetical protein